MPCQYNNLTQLRILYDRIARTPKLKAISLCIPRYFIKRCFKVYFIRILKIGYTLIMKVKTKLKKRIKEQDSLKPD